MPVVVGLGVHGLHVRAVEPDFTITLAPKPRPSACANCRARFPGLKAHRLFFWVERFVSIELEDANADPHHPGSCGARAHRLQRQSGVNLSSQTAPGSSPAPTFRTTIPPIPSAMHRRAAS